MAPPRTDACTEFLAEDSSWRDPQGPVYRLLCPTCGFDYNHPGTPEVAAGYDKYATGLGVRGDVTSIPFTCENGHEWMLSFGFHKGNVFVFARPLATSKKADQ